LFAQVKLKEEIFVNNNNAAVSKLIMQNTFMWLINLRYIATLLHKLYQIVFILKTIPFQSKMGINY